MDDMLKAISGLLDEKLSPINERLDKIENIQQEIKEKLDGFSTEYSTTMQDLSNKVDVLDGKIDKLSADIIAVEAITGKNMADIAHLKLIK